MARKPRYVTIMLIPDGTEERHGWRVRRWIFNTVIYAFGALLVGMVLFFVFYGQVLSRAAMTEQLQKENEVLRRYQIKVRLLENNLLQAREVVTRLTKLAGLEYEFPELPPDSTIFAGLDSSGRALLARSAAQDWTIPAGLPVEGFITRGYEEAEEHFHPGVDIACAVGTPVLATGSGEVAYAAFDSVYGYIVVVRHNDSISTIYGHNSELLVDVGQEVPVGSRIALSGNTGISTAPHVHYEMRIHDKPLNPLANPYDEKGNHEQ
jgi:murein DD-endopeptidase MepM/ murein hydrolase activator NlpD